MIEHVTAFFRRSQEKLRYQAYITDALKALTENTTHRLIPGVGAVDYGAYMPLRWYGNEQTEPEREKTGDEIAEEIILKAGLTLKGGNE